MDVASYQHINKQIKQQVFDHLADDDMILLDTATMTIKHGRHMQFWCEWSSLFFFCIAERARDIVGQQLEVRKRSETLVDCRDFTGYDTQANQHTDKTN